MTLAALGNWKKREEHNGEFGDGDQYLVAVPVSTRGGAHYYEYSVITWDCDEEGAVAQCNGESWGWDWESVDFYIEMTK